jgi:hypothetical protein
LDNLIEISIYSIYLYPVHLTIKGLTMLNSTKLLIVAATAGTALVASIFTIPALAQKPQMAYPAEVGTLCNPGAGLEKHPEMCRALRSLYRTRQELRRSAHDYNGLRAKALQDTNAAYSDVLQAIKSDQQ